MRTAPLLPFVLRLGALAAVGYLAQRLIRRHAAVGHTDQRAEDALDDLCDGLAAHRPADSLGQRNTSLRLRRSFTLGARRFEIDASAIARLRLREIE
jgi:hypothetical protein